MTSEAHPGQAERPTATDVEYICIGGAGNKSAAFFGILRAMEANYGNLHRKDWREFTASLKGTAGTSAGALAALVIYLGLEVAMVMDICRHLIDDIANVFTTPDIGNLVDKYGMDNCAYMRSVISHILRAAGLCEDTTFASMDRLMRREFACTGTNLNTRRGVVFSTRTSPHMKVVDAVSISMNMPVLFAPVKYDGDLYVDGSLTIRVPHNFFDFAKTEFWLIRPAPRAEISSWRDFVRCLVDLQPDSTFEEDNPNVLWIKAFGEEEYAFDFVNTRMRHGSQGQMQAGYVSAMQYLYPDLPCVCVGLIRWVLSCCNLNDAAAAFVTDPYTEEA